MLDTLALIVVGLAACSTVMLVVLLVRLRGGQSPKDPGAELTALQGELQRVERGLRDELARMRDSADEAARHDREELQSIVRLNGDSLQARMSEHSTLQQNQLDHFARQLTALTSTLDERLDRVRGTVEEKLALLQADNSTQLEKMRATVDEKLHATLETRLGESFRFVSERLTEVQQGLGEMRTLATGVGDLKKVLTNVRTRGTWGEVQLGALLEQILTPDQYAQNVAVREGSNDRVEFAVKFPGRDEHERSVLWLPIDAKFPVEDYQRLLDAVEQGNRDAVDEASAKLEARLRTEAKSIREKYVDPPRTTDFAILFLPTEGLYAEAIRRPGLADYLREMRVTIAGPTTLAAILNSLQMGFRTLAIEKRSSEVWTLLGAVKTEFGRFGDILEKTQKKLVEATNTLEDAGKKTRTIERRLRQVQDVNPSEIPGLLEPPEAEG
jgi:DNA recombination protein RmuC